MDERRKDRRISRELFLRFGPRNPEHAGLGQDFSRTGLYVQSQTLFPIQTKLKIELHLPNGGKLLAAGLVAWVKDLPQEADAPEPKGMGIQLTEIPADYRALILSLQ